MRLQAESDAAQQIAVGSPYYDSVADETYNFYYLELTEAMLEFWRAQSGVLNPIHIVLHPAMGSASLYASMQENSDLQPNRLSWVKPDNRSYEFSSNSHLAQEVVTISPEEVGECFAKSRDAALFKKYKSISEPAECALVIAVYGSGYQSFTPYSLTAYIAVQRLFEERAIESRVEEGAY